LSIFGELKYRAATDRTTLVIRVGLSYRFSKIVVPARDGAPLQEILMNHNGEKVHGGNGLAMVPQER
jgi:hypothetical protein